MKMMNKVCALVLSVALCAGMAAPAFAYGGEPVEEVEQPVLTSPTDEEDVVTVTDETSGALTPEGNLTLVDDYHTNYSDGFQNDWRSFMSEKSDKLRAMLEKEKERRIKLNNRIEILERRIQEEDSAEVNEMVRTAKVTPEQLAALLRQSATATPTPAALSAVGATFEKEVDTDED